jgi:hypothetical protein
MLSEFQTCDSRPHGSLVIRSKPLVFLSGNTFDVKITRASDAVLFAVVQAYGSYKVFTDNR